MKPTILCMDKGHPGQLDAMAEHFELVRPKGPDPERAIREHQNDIQGIVSFLTPISDGLINALPNLEIIACGAVGYDHINVDAAKKRQIAVTNTPDVLTADTADMAIALMLNVARRIVEGDAFIRAGLWTQGPLPLGTSLSDKTIGILGLGRIGKAIAERASTFQMDVVYHGRNERADQPYTYYKSLNDMARDVDFLILACPGGEETRGIVDYDVLEALGPEGYVINIARGTVINQDDLLVALRNKFIAGAGLDVYEVEPHVPEALIKMDNVVLAPRIGSATKETREKMGQIVLQNLLAHFNGEELLTPIA